MSASISSGHNDASAYRRLVPILLKSLFALMIKNFPGFRRDFRVTMWGTSSSDNKLADDLGNAIEGHTNRRSSVRFFYSGKLAPGN
jgi:hypothetical protein